MFLIKFHTILYVVIAFFVSLLAYHFVSKIKYDNEYEGKMMVDDFNMIENDGSQLEVRCSLLLKYCEYTIKICVIIYIMYVEFLSILIFFMF